MANQELNNSLTNLAGTPSRGKRIAFVFLVLSVLALLILAALLRSERQPAATTPNEVIAEQAPPARQGESAAVAAVSRPAKAVEQPATFTEVYWDMAAALPPSSPAAAAEQPATFTEVYWDMAAALPVREVPGETEEDYAYYTERYWILGQQGN